MNTTLFNNKLAVLNFVSLSDQQALQALFKQEQFDVWCVDCSHSYNKSSLLYTIDQALFNNSGVSGWDQLEAMLGEKLDSSQSPKTALLLLSPQKFIEGNLESFCTLTSILIGVSRAHYQTQDIFVTFLLDAGVNYPPLDRMDSNR